MCLAVPGKIIRITSTDPFLMADVDFLGAERQVCLNSVDANVGDYVIVHAGVAISVLDPQEALQTVNDLEKMTDYQEKHFNNE
jgi:hydrogenase assembly chaperone hypC/hupF